MSNPSPQTIGWRYLRRGLIALAILVTLIGLFYTEENWRGQRAWEDSKRSAEAQGIDFKWQDYIPAEVPEDQNVFGVPEMQQWFNGRGPTELSHKIAYPGTINTGESSAAANEGNARLVVADVKTQLPGTSVATGSNVLQWDDAHAAQKVALLINRAVGPMVMHPGSTNLLFTARPLDEIRPAQILLVCQTAPTSGDLSHFLPRVSAFTDTTDDDPLQIEPQDGGYKVTMPAPYSTGEFLKWNGRFADEFALIREALRRPMVRMKANYNTPETVAIPNFVTSRAFVQSMAAMSDCHLLEGNPAAALDDLTRMHEICHIFTNRPITLVGAMINVAVRGAYVDAITHGLRLHAWHEAQLPALEEQLKSIDLVEPLWECLHQEPVSACESLQTITPARLFLLFFSDWGRFRQRWAARLVPRGWIYENMALTAQRARLVDTWLDPVNGAVFPQKLDQDQAALSSVSPHSPYSFIHVQFIPNNLKACQRCALVQTRVHQAIVACALERFHLARGEYPETLSALVPQYLSEIPNDVIGRQAPHYRRATDGTYLLYSIGWSERDCGGAPGKSIGEGDWVWPELNLL